MATTLSEHVRVYVRERAAAGTLAPATVPNVRCTLLGFAAFVGDIPPKRLTSAHVEAWMASKSWARSSARNRFSTLRTFCHWLIRRGHLAVDPTLHLKAPRQPRPVPRAVDVATIRHLVASLPDSRARFVVVWMVQLGLRAVELTRLEVGDVDEEQRSVVIRGKGGWQRLLPITDEAWSVYITYLVEHPARAGPILRSYNEPWKGISPNWLSRLVSRWMRDAGAPGTGHGLRHSTATHLLRGQGADLRHIQQVLGHRSLTSTSVYLPHSDLTRLRAVMEGRRYMPDDPTSSRRPA